MRYVRGQFELHKAARKLYFDGELVPVSQLGIDILLYLIELNGAIATKKELLEAIWPGEEAGESRLVKQISLLRRSLESLSADSSVIQTIPGSGYQTESWEVRMPGTSTVKIDQQVAQSEDSPRQATLIAPAAGEGTNPPSPTGRPAGSGRWLRRVALAVPLIVFSFYLFLSIISQIEVRFKFGPSKIVRVRHSQGFKRSLNFSRDGRSLACYQSTEPGGRGQLAIVNLTTDSTVPLPGRWNADEEIAWAPDNQSIALLNSNDKEDNRRQLIISSVDGQQVRNIGEVASGGLDWSPDGQNLAVCERRGASADPASDSTLIYLCATDGSNRKQLTTPATQSRVVDSHPRFSPDGSRIAFIRRNVTNNRVGVHLVDLASGQERQLVAGESSITDLDWSPNGDELLFLSSRNGEPQLWYVSGTKGGEWSTPAPFTRISTPILSFSLSAQGELAYVCLPGNNSQIDLMPFTEGALESVFNRLKFQDRDYVPCTITASNSTYTPTFSPDSRQIAFISTRSGSAEIWSANPDCTNHRQLTFRNLSGIEGLDWSGDGTRIAFSQKIDGQFDLFSLDLASGQINRVTETADDEFSPVWSQKSGALYYSWESVAKERPSSQIRRVDLTTKVTDTLVEESGWRFAVSSNQEELYFTRQDQIWHKRLKTGQERRLANLDDLLRGVSWDLKDDRLYLITRREKPWPSLFRLDLPDERLSGPVEEVMELDAFITNSTSKSSPGFDIAPNTRAIATTSISSSATEIRFLKYARP